MEWIVLSAAVDVVYLDCRKVFGTIFQEKLAAHGLDRWILHWLKNCLNC